jgi:hypothetical protein
MDNKSPSDANQIDLSNAPKKDGDDGRGRPDPLIRYGFYAALSLAGLCLIFAISYISYYSVTTTRSLEAHTSNFLDSKDINALTAVLIARTAQNKTLLQSCGAVAGIAFGFLGFALFLLGVQGEVDADGTILSTNFSLRRLAPGALIMLAAMVLIGFASIHAIELELGPDGSSTGRKDQSHMTDTAPNNPSSSNPSPAPQPAPPKTDNSL